MYTATSEGAAAAVASVAALYVGALYKKRRCALGFLRTRHASILYNIFLYMSVKQTAYCIFEAFDCIGAQHQIEGCIANR